MNIKQFDKMSDAAEINAIDFIKGAKDCRAGIKEAEGMTDDYYHGYHFEKEAMDLINKTEARYCCKY